MTQLVISLTAWIRAHKQQTILIVAGIILFALCLTMPVIIGAMGFSASEPVLGSATAAWQSSIGSVVAGSLFSFLQSAAMGGAAMGLFTGLGGLGAVIALSGALTIIPTMKERCREFIEKATTGLKGGCQKMRAEAGNFWLKIPSSVLKMRNHDG